MLYLSQILNSKVKDSSDRTIGRLKDILIKPKAGIYSPLDFLLIKVKKRKEFCVPYEFVENVSREGTTLKTLFDKIPIEQAPEKGYISLNKDVMDQQIVDVGGARVVRVNDLKIGLFEEKMSVLGLDVSTKGLLRRLGVAGLDFFNVFEEHLIDWRKAQPVKKGALRLDTISQDMAKLHPADLANIIENLSVKQGSKLVNSLDADTAAQVVEEMDPEVKKILVNYLGPEKAAKIIDKMSADEVTDLIQVLSKSEAKHLLAYLQNGKLKKVEKLIRYDEDTAGGLMTTDFASGRPEWTVKEAVAEIKKLSPSMRSMLYLYITDKEGVFKGAVSLRRLLTADSKQTLKELTKRFPQSSTLRVKQGIKDIVQMMTKYNLYTAAVLDDSRKMVGMVTIDDVMRQVFPKA